MDEVNAFDHMNANMDALYQKIDSIHITPSTPTILALIASVAPPYSTVRYAELMDTPIEIVKRTLQEDPPKRVPNL